MGLWRDIFGPGQNEVWGGLAKQIGADFTPADWLKRGRVDLHKGQVIITLDTYTVSTGKSSSTYTRMRSPLRNRRGLTMNIHRTGIFSGMGKLMGMQDIIVGDPMFDDNFVIQGKPESTIKAFLQDANIRRLIEAQPSIAFMIQADEGWFFKQYPEGIEELYFQCRGVVTDEKQLRDLFELFVAAIDKLTTDDTGCDFEVRVIPK